MGIKHVFLFSGITLAVGTASAKNYNKEVPSVTLTFSKGSIEFTKRHQELVDSLYGIVAPGERLKIEMLQPEESMFTTLERTRLAYQRSEAVLKHCYQRKYDRKEFYAEIIPLDVPHTIETDDLNRASYRFYQRHASVTSVYFTLDEKTATSQVCGMFDSNYHHDKQAFTYSPEEQITASLVSGTQIKIPANSLVFENGHAPTKAIVLEVAEYTEMDAIIMKSMTTTAGGKALQTGGMWHIEASSEGKPLIMKQGNSYSIEVAKDNSTKPMQVFVGKLKNGLIDWELQNDGKVTATTTTVTVPVSGNEKENTTRNLNLNDVSNLDVNQLNVLNQNQLNNLNNLNVVNNVNVNNLNRKQKRNKNSKVDESIYFDPQQEERTQTTQKAIYAMELNDFGWINCDAFDQTKELTDFYVKGDVTTASSVMLIYPKRKSVLPGYICSDGKTVKFSNIATDEMPMLVVVTKTDDPNTILKCIKTVNPGTQKSVVVNTVKADLASLKNDLKGKISDL